MAIPDQCLPGFYLSAACKSSGKTILSIGICAALAGKKRKVQPFKKGPDYIDPLWLSHAAGKPCYNLDFNTQSAGRIVRFFERQSRGSDGVIVEGNKGLYDGVSVDGCDSNAALAKLLGLSVILVLDTRGVTRGIAPLLLGYRQFDADIDFAGVILNRVAGPRHEQKLRASIETYTDFKIIGAVANDDRLRIGERHLGLTPGNEVDHPEERIALIRQVIESAVDLDLPTPAAPVLRQPGPGKTNARAMPERKVADVRIGIPQDAAFGFYYADDMEEFSRRGAQIVRFSTIEDDGLPQGVDGLFIGGGFPEVYLDELSDNAAMRQSIFDFINAGGPVYAECGGLMYLGHSIRWNGRQAAMVGALPVRAVMQEKPVGRGYVELQETGDSVWGGLAATGRIIHAHEFHYSRVEFVGEVNHFAFTVKRGWGLDGKHDGMVHKNVVAGYAHLRSAGTLDWVARFVDFVRQCKAGCGRHQSPGRSIIPQSGYRTG